MPRPLRLTMAMLTAALATATLTASAAEARWQHFASPGGTPAPGAAQSASPQQLLGRVRHAFRQSRSAAGATDLTPLLRQLAVQLPRLHGSQKRRAEALLARPTDGAADPQENGYTSPEAPGSPACSTHYCVHWVTGGEDAPDPTDGNANGIPDFVESASAVAEKSHSVENGELGWREPKSDGTIGEEVGKTDIYLKQLGGTGIYGYAAPDPGQPTSDHSVYAYLVIDNDFQKSEFPQYDSPITPLEVTLAHEYNHILQLGYDFIQDTWFLESTAVWMEGKVYPADLDYLQYLQSWAQLTALPLTTFNGTDPNDRRNLKVYGTAVWNKWLDAQFGPEVMRGAWEVSLDTQPASFAVAAYDRSIREHGGHGFGDQFDRFAAATAEWQAQNSGFPEGAAYPDVARAGKVSVNSAGGTVKLNHTTYALVDVTPSSAARIKLGMIAPAGTDAALALVGRTGGQPGGTSTVALKVLPSGGSGSVIVENPSQYSRLTAVLVNSDAEVTGASEITGDWTYARDSQPYYARVTTDFKAPRVLRSAPAPGARGVSPGARVKVTFSERVLGVNAKSLRLVAPNGRSVHASVSFKAGSRVAKLVPSGALGRGRRYRVRVSRAVTDTAVNPLAHTTTWSFTTRR
jgi:Bacterial Ig-like domain